MSAFLFRFCPGEGNALMNRLRECRNDCAVCAWLPFKIDATRSSLLLAVTNKLTTVKRDCQVDDIRSMVYIMVMMYGSWNVQKEEVSKRKHTKANEASLYLETIYVY